MNKLVENTCNLHHKGIKSPKYKELLITEGQRSKKNGRKMRNRYKQKIYMRYIKITFNV